MIEDIPDDKVRENVKGMSAKETQSALDFIEAMMQQGRIRVSEQVRKARESLRQERTNQKRLARYAEILREHMHTATFLSLFPPDEK